MTKRNKTYSLDDVSIELVKEMANLKSGFTQSSILNTIILDKARDLSKRPGHEYLRIQALVRKIELQSVLGI